MPWRIEEEKKENNWQLNVRVCEGQKLFSFNAKYRFSNAIYRVNRKLSRETFSSRLNVQFFISDDRMKSQIVRPLI